MTSVIHDKFDGPAQEIPLEQLADGVVRRLAAAGSREAIRELARRRRNR